MARRIATAWAASQVANKTAGVFDRSDASDLVVADLSRSRAGRVQCTYRGWEAVERFPFGAPIQPVTWQQAAQNQ